jgi:ornithine decarboxylase
MNFVQRFTFLFSAPTFEAEDLEGLRVAEIIAAIQRMGFQVIRARRIEDAEIAVQTDAAIGCLVVDWGKKGLEGKAASLWRRSNPDSRVPRLDCFAALAMTK